MDIQKLAEMHSHLSHLVDKLSAISSQNCFMEMIINTVVGDQSFTYGRSNTEGHLSDFVKTFEEATQEAFSIISEARETLNEGLSDEELRKLRSLS